ncbi:MAG TPA: Stk1 family PASTA domain-containing Ser/Thr kinase [Firmicutes bacterium]|nr:Stk1 family PASTA domain-containing Ser/Thr kinase [Bacillota bacterium]
MDKYTGKRLDGRYEIHELLGVGGMAVVYRAYDTIDDRMVAIKILKDEFAGNSDFLRRFRNESKAIAVLSHPNIVKVYDVSFGDRIQYIVMEYVDGITLKQYLDQQKETVPWKEALHFTVQILRALQHAHEKGIVHRDIKPQNIMLLQDGTIKVMDFGIARFARSETRTMTDKAIGSVHYIAPEQARGDVTDERADIYSVGVMLYEMLTGRLPFEADNAVSVAIMQLQANPTLPRDINPDIPEGLQEITMKAMQKAPSQRYQSAAEMLQDIETFRRNPAVRFDYKYFVDDTPTRYVNAIENVKGSTGPLSYNDDYEYEEDLGKKKGSKKTKMVLAGIGTAFLIMLVILGVFFIVNQNNQSAGEEDTVVVPNFIGMVYQDEILDNEKYADFTFTLQEGNDPEQDPGVVLQQSPNEGIEVKKGREIVLTINQGDEPVKIPEVAGMTEDDAVEALRNMDLIPKVVTVMDEEVGQGYVIETDPAEGSEVDAGSQVTVYVSGGPEENISVPAVIDKSLDAARAEIIAAGLTVGELIPQDDSDKPANTVIETNPLPGVKVASGTKVDITYSSGQQSVKTVEVFLALPDVSNDIDVKVYVDGKLDNDQSGTINPNATSNPGLYTLTFEGTSGTQTLQVTLDGQNYATFTLDFDSGNASQQGSYGNYQPPQDTSSEEENGGGGEAGTGNGGGQGVTRD